MFAAKESHLIGSYVWYNCYKELHKLNYVVFAKVRQVLAKVFLTCCINNNNSLQFDCGADAMCCQTSLTGLWAVLGKMLRIEGKYCWSDY